MRISNSFSEGEIQVLDFVVQTLLRGGSPSMAARHKDFPTLCRKIMAMKVRLTDVKAENKSSIKDQAHESVDKSAELPVLATVEAPIALPRAV